MMRLNNIHTVYFLGIGGIGMSALARYFKLNGSTVLGYDKTKTQLTEALENEGISIHYTPDVNQIPEKVDLVVYTPAVSEKNPEWVYILEEDLTRMKRAEVLGLISSSGQCLAVAGTHGKTTTSAILAHILKSNFGEVSAFVGGILSNYDTNFLYADNNDFFVVEADEFDRSFLHLDPQIAVINSVDADHLDIYGEEDAMLDSFKAFANKVKDGGMLIINSEIPNIFEAEVATFGIETKADYVAKNIRISDGKYIFDFYHPNGVISDMSLALPGRHNIENAIAASAIAGLCGVSDNEILKAISSFKGVKRRFEITKNQNGTVYIDDYAHHPTEITKVLESAREMYAGKKLSVIFQPHLYSRTRDFEAEFAKALSGFDEVILLDIYPARELPIEGITSENLLEKISVPNKKVMAKNQVVDHLNNTEIEVLLTLGAGDIDTLVEPIKEIIAA